MRWIFVAVFLATFPLLQVAGQCGENNMVCPDSCHCPDTLLCPDKMTRRCGTGGTGGTGECAQPWSGPTCRRRNLILRRLKKYSMLWGRSFKEILSPQHYIINMLDGNLTTFWLSMELNPWAWLDVSTYPQPVHSMRIVIVKGAQFLDRIKGFRIEVSNDTALGSGETCYTDTSKYAKLIYDINCTRPMVGRYVFITRPDKVALNVHEFEVYGCENYWFGYQCDRKCNCANSSEVCDKTTGSCRVGGCHSGFTGPDCYTHCENNRFGYKCERKCNCANAREVCAKITGSCGVSGCAPGYTDIDCYTDCEDYKFGYKCERECNCANAREVCDKITGSCGVSGCFPGYTEIDCYTSYSDGSFGVGCSGTYHCLRANGCNKMDGSCTGGCASGYKGLACQTECDDVEFGGDCTGSCHCRHRSPCNKIDGHCDDGCAPGYKNIDNCQTECRDGFFGFDCNSTCRCFDHNEACHKTTGRCGNGCAAGYTGIDCQQECNSGQFGQGCQFSCHCSNGSRCDEVNGTCPGNCSDGYIGEACQALAHTALPLCQKDSSIDIGMTISVAILATLLVVALVIAAVLFHMLRKARKEIWKYRHERYAPAMFGNHPQGDPPVYEELNCATRQ